MFEVHNIFKSEKTSKSFQQTKKLKALVFNELSSAS